MRSFFKHFFILLLILVGVWRCNHILEEFSMIFSIILEADFLLVLLALVCHLFNHLLRALRWQFLLKNQWFYVPLIEAWEAEMAGFFSNIFVPRSGEFTRCRILNKIRSVPFSNGFASVIAERSIDILFFFLQLLIIFITASFINSAKFSKVAQKILHTLGKRTLFFTWQHIIFLVVGLVILLFVFRYSISKLPVNLFQRFTSFKTNLLREIRDAFKYYKAVILLLTFAIWISYFYVEYISLHALPGTSNLSFFAALCVFIAINIGAAIPIPGNFGGYHVLVSAALIVFGVPKNIALSYATLAHGIQFFNAFVVGGLMSFAAAWRIKKMEKLREVQ